VAHYFYTSDIVNSFTYLQKHKRLNMTRINVGIPPAELTGKHLIAEHREIKRIPNAIAKGKYKLDGIPDKFTLGKGHVKFFYNKLLYLHFRYLDLYAECIKRGFNVTCYNECFYNMPDELYNDYQPTKRDVEIIKQRIQERLNGK
jgi:deoxyribonuclease (pyrimidine dimer)